MDIFVAGVVALSLYCRIDVVCRCYIEIQRTSVLLGVWPSTSAFACHWCLEIHYVVKDIWATILCTHWMLYGDGHLGYNPVQPLNIIFYCGYYVGKLKVDAVIRVACSLVNFHAALCLTLEQVQSLIMLVYLSWSYCIALCSPVRTTQFFYN